MSSRSIKVNTQPARFTSRRRNPASLNQQRADRPMIEAQRSSISLTPWPAFNDTMSRASAQPKVQEVLVATYTPPFIEALRVCVAATH